MRNHLGRLAGLVLAAGLALAGCSSDGATRDGSMTMYLTDAPSDSITAAVVTVERIYLQGGDDSVDTAARVVLLDSAFTVDLRTLANSSQLLFAGVPVPGGAYAQLRFVISGGYIQVTENGTSRIYASSPTYPGLPDGATVDGQLQMPSYAQSGLKVTIPAGALRFDGDQRIVLVDFDVSQSFGHGAGPDTWVMHPVVRGAEMQATGTVQGTVTFAPGIVLPGTVTGLGDFQVHLGGDVQPLVAVDGAAHYSFGALVPGSYELSLTGPAGVVFTVAPALPDTVTVGSGATVTQDLVITSVQ